jgi:hypothetical protein
LRVNKTTALFISHHESSKEGRMSPGVEEVDLLHERRADFARPWKQQLVWCGCAEVEMLYCFSHGLL